MALPAIFLLCFPLPEFYITETGANAPRSCPSLVLCQFDCHVHEIFRPTRPFRKICLAGLMLVSYTNTVVLSAPPWAATSSAARPVFSPGRQPDGRSPPGTARSSTTQLLQHRQEARRSSSSSPARTSTVLNRVTSPPTRPTSSGTLSPTASSSSPTPTASSSRTGSGGQRRRPRSPGRATSATPISPRARSISPT